MNSSIKNNPGLPGVTFRFAALEDIDAIVAIENQSFGFPWPPQHFISELDQPFSFTLVAQQLQPDPGDILGYIIFWQLFDELHILNLAIRPDVRRLGLGRRLLAAAMQQAREHDCQTAWLEVRPSNTAALALYHSLGFSTALTRKGYYGDTGEDALILMLPL